MDPRTTGIERTINVWMDFAPPHFSLESEWDFSNFISAVSDCVQYVQYIHLWKNCASAAIVYTLKNITIEFRPTDGNGKRLLLFRRRRANRLWILRRDHGGRSATHFKRNSLSTGSFLVLWPGCSCMLPPRRWDVQCTRLASSSCSSRSVTILSADNGGCKKGGECKGRGKKAERKSGSPRNRK